MRDTYSVLTYAELRAVAAALEIVIRALELEEGFEPPSALAIALAACRERRQWIADILTRSDMTS